MYLRTKSSRRYEDELGHTLWVTDGANDGDGTTEGMSHEGHSLHAQLIEHFGDEADVVRVLGSEVLHRAYRGFTFAEAWQVGCVGHEAGACGSGHGSAPVLRP